MQPIFPVDEASLPIGRRPLHHFPLPARLQRVGAVTPLPHAETLWSGVQHGLSDGACDDLTHFPLSKAGHATSTTKRPREAAEATDVVGEDAILSPGLQRCCAMVLYGGGTAATAESDRAEVFTHFFSQPFNSCADRRGTPRSAASAVDAVGPFAVQTGSGSGGGVGGAGTVEWTPFDEERFPAAVPADSPLKKAMKILGRLSLLDTKRYFSIPGQHRCTKAAEEGDASLVWRSPTEYEGDISLAGLLAALRSMECQYVDIVGVARSHSHSPPTTAAVAGATVAPGLSTSRRAVIVNQCLASVTKLESRCASALRGLEHALVVMLLRSMSGLSSRTLSDLPQGEVDTVNALRVEVKRTTPEVRDAAAKAATRYAAPCVCVPTPYVVQLLQQLPDIFDSEGWPHLIDADAVERQAGKALRRSRGSVTSTSSMNQWPSVCSVATSIALRSLLGTVQADGAALVLSVSSPSHRGGPEALKTNSAGVPPESGRNTNSPIAFCGVFDCAFKGHYEQVGLQALALEMELFFAFQLAQLPPMPVSLRGVLEVLNYHAKASELTAGGTPAPAHPEGALQCPMERNEDGDPVSLVGVLEEWHDLLALDPSLAATRGLPRTEEVLTGPTWALLHLARQEPLSARPAGAKELPPRRGRRAAEPPSTAPLDVVDFVDGWYRVLRLRRYWRLALQSAYEEVVAQWCATGGDGARRRVTMPPMLPRTTAAFCHSRAHAGASPVATSVTVRPLQQRCLLVLEALRALDPNRWFWYPAFDHGILDFLTIEEWISSDVFAIKGRGDAFAAMRRVLEGMVDTCVVRYGPTHEFSITITKIRRQFVDVAKERGLL